MSELPKGFTITEGDGEYGPTFTLLKGDVWLDEDFDRERILAYANYLARPRAPRKTILDTLRLAEEELERKGAAESIAGKRVRSLLNVMYAEEVPANGGQC